nr:MAG TPA: N acetylmuramoyl L alanine amidase endolysin [Caudoviricetes sp.]
MSNSNLVTRWWPANPTNYTRGREGNRIEGIVVHHGATTSLDSIGLSFARAGRNGSAHYGIVGNQVHQYADETSTTWHCNNWFGNTRTVSIETTNSTGAPNWEIAPDTFETLVKLVADIAKRNNLGRLWINPKADMPTLSGHKDWYGAATVCPGPSLYPRLQEIADRANAINFPPEPQRVPVVWVDITPFALKAKTKVDIIDLDTGADKGDIQAGIVISNLVQETTVNGKKYYRTLYSKTKDFNNGILAEALEPVVAPVSPESIINGGVKETKAEIKVSTEYEKRPITEKEVKEEAKKDDGFGDDIAPVPGVKPGMKPEEVQKLIEEHKKNMEEAKEIIDEVGKNIEFSPKTKMIVYLLGDLLIIAGTQAPLVVALINTTDPVTFGQLLGQLLLSTGTMLLFTFKLLKKKDK